MPVIKVFEDNTLHPVEVRKGQDVSFVFLPSGRQTAQGRERPVYHATLDNDRGRVINVTWQDKGMVNLPDLTVGASVPFAEMIASGMAT